MGIERFDRIVYNGTVITVNLNFEIIGQGIVCIKDGLIDRVEPQREPISAYFADDLIDAEGGLILPGLVNAHVHLPMSLFRGLADDLPLSRWLERHIFPAEHRHVTPESVAAGTWLSCAEMLLSGTTACCDGYFYEDAVAEAVSGMGIRAVLGQGVIDFPAPGVADPKQNVEAAVLFIEKWLNRSLLIQPAIFCHSPRTCSAHTLLRAKQAAKKYGIRFQVHLAETRDEGERLRAEHGLSSVAYLFSLGLLDGNTLASHAVWVDDADIALLAENRVKLVHNPESNMKLASGVSPVPRLISAGIVVGLGTDGCASNNNLDLFQEMDAAAKLHKVMTKDPTVMDARTVLRMATIEGAKAIGLGDRIGSLEPGKAADIVVVDTRKPHLTPMYHPESHLVYAASGSDVSHVLIGGEVRVRGGRLVDQDLDGIMEQAASIGFAVKAAGSYKENESHGN